MAAPTLSSPPTRRERMRAQTSAEIKKAARAQLIEHGRGGVQLRAIARHLGMTAPALYRYFPSLDELIAALTVDLYDELTTQMTTARDADPNAHVFAQMMAVSRAFRTWAMNNPAEFGLLFATPPVSFGEHIDTPCEAASARFGGVFAELFLQIWAQHPFPLDEEVAPDLAESLTPYWTWLVEERMSSIPMAAVVVFLEDWIRLYGTVAMETFGHLRWATSQGDAMFEQTLRSMAASVGALNCYSPQDDKN
jgi:AcrR family transcriptional regulator